MVWNADNDPQEYITDEEQNGPTDEDDEDDEPMKYLTRNADGNLVYE